MSQEQKANEKDTNLPNKVANQIIEYVTYHKLKAGDRLPSERVLAQMFNVSRVSLREAIRGLVIINFIEVRNGVGAFVKNPKALVSGGNLQMNIHKDQLMQLTEVRRILELRSLELIVDTISEDDIEEIEEIMIKMEYPYVLNEDLGNLDDEFHIKVNQLCGNEVLVDLIENMIMLSKKIWKDTGEDIYKTIRDSIPMHRRLLEALKLHDKAAVFEAYNEIVTLDEEVLSAQRA